MKTKTIPFNLETAKKIQSGEIEGKIKTRCGEKVRILCTDVIDDKYPIAVALMEEGREMAYFLCALDGKFLSADGGVYKSDFDLHLEVPDEQHPIEESELYQAGYKVGFEAGRCVAFDEKKGCAIKKETPKHEFKPFDKVLMRSPSSGYMCWYPHHYCHYTQMQRMQNLMWQWMALDTNNVFLTRVTSTW